MMQSLYVGATGMRTHSEGLQIVSNNLANVSTIGYKQQLMLFEDLISKDVVTGSARNVEMSQVGLGVRSGFTRTLFTEGSYEPGSAITDLAIGGKGFFQVTDKAGETFYTRAGNFRYDKDGVLREPTGCAVTGIRIENGKEVGGLGPLSINFNEEGIATDPPKATNNLNPLLNLGFNTDKAVDPDNPYFAMLNQWNGESTPPLGNYSYAQPLKFFDANGVQHEATVYFDSAPSVNGQKNMEFIVTVPPDKDGTVPDGPPGTRTGAGLLMAGTLTFSSAGELLNMSAFTPKNATDKKNLSTWTPAPLAEGMPQFSLTLPGQTAQNISMNFGITSSAAWQNGGGTAADVGTNPARLPAMVPVDHEAGKTTAFSGSSSLKSYKQNGYAKGELMDTDIGQDGVISAIYTNGQVRDIYRIPLFRFNSEDGLRREGKNLFSATNDSGAMSNGRAGTENYGPIFAKTIEMSNVDMAKEMTNMIITQRGFQSNSKTVTTADQMLQKAMELKRT